MRIGLIHLILVTLLSCNSFDSKQLGEADDVNYSGCIPDDLKKQIIEVILNQEDFLMNLHPALVTSPLKLRVDPILDDSLMIQFPFDMRITGLPGCADLDLTVVSMDCQRELLEYNLFYKREALSMGGAITNWSGKIQHERNSFFHVDNEPYGPNEIDVD